MSIHIPLHSEYLKLINPSTDRVRNVSDVEKANPAQMRGNDQFEAKAVIQFYLSGLERGIRALLSGDLEKFDAVIGDHNCHVTACFALNAFKDAALFEEAQNLLGLVKAKKGKIAFKPSQNGSPQELMKEFGFPVSLSEKMKYLISCAILRTGTECTENRDGSMTLRVFPNLLQQHLSKACPKDLLEKLITPLRECVNQGSVAFVQKAAKAYLSEEEYACVRDSKVGKTPRDETFLFPCAFYNMKASLKCVDEGSYFALVQYDPKRKVDHAPLLFKPHLIDLANVDRSSSVFVIQAFFNDTLSPQEVGRAIEDYGISKFLLASIAVNPQFLDMEEKAFRNNEDIRDLPQNCQKEIAYYRDEGRRLRINTEDPEICRVVHTYADTLQNLTKGAK